MNRIVGLFSAGLLFLAMGAYLSFQTGSLPTMWSPVKGWYSSDGGLDPRYAEKYGLPAVVSICIGLMCVGTTVWNICGRGAVAAGTVRRSD